METGAIIIALLQALPYIVTAAVGVAAIWKSLKAKQYKVASEITSKTLTDLVLALELAPQTDGVKKAKQAIKAVATYTGSESAQLESTVIQVVGALEKAGLKTSGDNTSPLDIALAVRAVQEAREAREKAKRGIIPATVAGLLGLLLIVSLVGCAPVRYTTEVIIPGDAVRGRPGELTIIWPAGVRKADLYSTEISSRTLTVAPLR